MKRGGIGDFAVADALLEHVAVVDKRGRILAVNAAWDRLAVENGGGPAGSNVGGDYFELCQSKPAMGLPMSESVHASLRAIAEGRLERFTCEYPSTSKGNVRWFLISAARLAKKQGTVISHIAISQRRPTEYAAPESSILFGDIIEGTTDAVFLCDPAGNLLLVNSALAQWFGQPVSAMVGHNVADIGTPEIGRIVQEQNAAIIEAGQTRTFEITSSTVHGVRTFLITKGLHRNREGTVQGVFGIARDISELKAMEREIIETSDKEKHRLGQELHENLCQYLVGISLLGNALYEELLRLNIKQAEDARQITGLVKDSVSEVRALVKGLAPMPLEQEEGLIAALQELAEQARRIGKIKCSFKGPPSTNFIAPATSMHLYRIAQEAVHNAIKHSQATRLKIILSNTRRAVVLTVQDNGIGFPAYPSLPDGSSGLGFHIMNYRSRAIGAVLEIRKLPVRGTAVICTMPK